MLRLTVIAHPGARDERVELIGDDRLGVWVRARPIEGRANAAIERALAAALGLRPREVEIVSGGASRRKIVEIHSLDLQALRARLRPRGLRVD
ncbi:MAG TPA: DUF167 domain-containing protein [Chloroflexota bacterium]